MIERTRRVLNLKIFFHMPARILTALLSSSNTHRYLRRIRPQVLLRCNRLHRRLLPGTVDDGFSRHVNAVDGIERTIWGGEPVRFLFLSRVGPRGTRRGG